MMKKLIVMMMLFAVMMVACNNDKQYEANVAEYKSLSMSLMTACSSQLYNIHTMKEGEYASQKENIDSMSHRLSEIYASLTPPIDKYKECYPYIKDAQKNLVRMVSTIELLKFNEDNHEESMRLLDEFNKELDAFGNAIEEVNLQTPNIESKQ